MTPPQVEVLLVKVLPSIVNVPPNVLMTPAPHITVLLVKILLVIVNDPLAVAITPPM